MYSKITRKSVQRTTVDHILLLQQRIIRLPLSVHKMGNDKAILKQGLLRLHRGGVSVSGLKKRKRVEVTLCHPSSLADVQLLYERLFLDVSSGGGRDGLDRKTIQYLGELGFAAALGTLFCAFYRSLASDA